MVNKSNEILVTLPQQQLNQMSEAFIYKQGFSDKEKFLVPPNEVCNLRLQFKSSLNVFNANSIKQMMNRQKTKPFSHDHFFM